MKKTPWYSNFWYMFLAIVLCWPLAAYMLYRHAREHPEDLKSNPNSDTYVFISDDD